MIFRGHQENITSHGFYLHFFFFLNMFCSSWVKLFMLGLQLSSFISTFQFQSYFVDNSSSIFLVYPNAIYCFFVWTYCFHWKLLLQLFQLFSLFDRLPPTRGLHLSEILKLGHFLTLQWSLWQEVFGRSLVGGS